ncbi:MAG: DNA repair protein RecO [Oscillospiraceae bacterium]|nr:DNA repair protein RecO [Oscillospiraceae bacterium]
MVVKIKGLVVKVKNINENDKYLTVLCEEYGKINFKASGVRNYKSKYIASAQPFAYSEFTLFKSPTFIRMNEAHIIENFYSVRLDLESLALSVYLADIASVLCVSESGENSGVLRLLLNALHIISNKKMPNKITKAVYELRALTKAGFMPSLGECEVCFSENLDECEDYIFFDVIGGSLICGGCLGKLPGSAAGYDSQRKLIRITGGVLKILRFVTGVRDERLFSFVLHDEDTKDEFSKVCEKYLLEQLGMNIDSLKYYKSYI